MPPPDEGDDREEHRPARGEQKVAQDVPEGEIHQETPPASSLRPPATITRLSTMLNPR